MANPTILVVEDNETEQFVLKQLLARFDYDALIVSSGEEALAALADGEFAAIVMDVTLPGISGLDCTRKIREEENDRRRIPVIALTARATKKDHDACFSSGMDDYISKPFDPEQLRRVLLRWVYQPNRPNLKLLRPVTHEESSEARD